MSNKTPIRVTGSFTPSGTQDVNIVSSITIPVSGPLTDTELRATPVPISGTVTANLGTIDGVATEVTLAAISSLLALRLDVALSTRASEATLSLLNAKFVDGNDIGDVTVNNGSGASAVNIQDGGNSITVDGPLTDTQLRATPVPVSGTISVGSTVTVVQPTGTNLHAVIDSGSITVNNASGASAVNVQDGGNSITVDGTVTSNIGTTGGLALDATLTGGTAKTRITDGTDNLDITAAGAAKVDGSAVTQPISAASLPLPTGASTAALQTQPGVDIGDVTVNNASGAGAVNIQDGGNSITVDGSVTVTQATGTNLHTVVDSGTIAATQSGTWNITNISGTVSLPTGAATSANQTTEITSLQLIDDIVHADNVGTGKSALISAMAQADVPSAVSDGKSGFLASTLERGLHVNLRNKSGQEIGTQTNPAFIRPTDGTNNMPMMDAGARSGFVKIFDGSGAFNTPAIVLSTPGGFGLLGVVNADAAGNIQAYKATGESYALVGATANTLATAGYLKIDASQRIVNVPAFETRSDTFTTTTSGTTVDTSTNPLKSFSIQVKGTGAGATSWTVVLEGSNDNTNFTTILTHTTASLDGATIYSAATLTPCLYFRSRCTAVVLGGASNIVATILGVQ